VGCNWFICDLFVERLGSDSETVYVLVLPACCVHTYVWADLLAVCKKTLNKKMALVVPKESHQNLRKSGSLAQVLKSKKKRKGRTPPVGSSALVTLRRWAVGEKGAR
jgi:hypothetical protein